MTDAVQSGTVSVRRFLIAPNDNLYVLFSTPTDIQTGGSGNCLLGLVERSTGVPTCIDSTLTQINWPSESETYRNPAIQFDNMGAIYYLGSATGSRMVLRRNLNGATTDLINDAIMVSDFLVLGDGSVILTGSTTATQASWVRRITPQGGLQNLISSGGSFFIRPFPDGNVYLGVWSPGNWGVRRFLTAENRIDTRYWISGSINSELNPDTQFDVKDICTGGVYESFCGWFGSMIQGSYSTVNGRAFVVAGSMGQGGVLMRYFPSVAVVPTAVTRVMVAQGIISQIVLAGLNSSSQNILTMIDTSTGDELQLIGPSNEVEIYHLNYVASTNSIMFDGLRFVDNRYVIGQVNLSNMQVMMSQTGSTKLVDFQTF